jgi:hypothetical protein
MTAEVLLGIRRKFCPPPSENRPPRGLACRKEPGQPDRDDGTGIILDKKRISAIMKRREWFVPGNRVKTG